MRVDLHCGDRSDARDLAAHVGDLRAQLCVVAP
jgi:hypothetical protein